MPDVILSPMGYKEKLLTLKEAFKIGHDLQFTLEEIEATFTKTGVYYTNTPAVKIKNPNAKALFTYPNTSTAARFDPTNKDYQSTASYLRSI